MDPYVPPERDAPGMAKDFSILPTNVNKVLDIIRRLKHCDALHVRRGFCINDATLTTATNHLMEEVVELQAEMLIGDDVNDAIDEAADVLMVYLHVLELGARAGKIPREDMLACVCERARLRLNKYWTTDPAQVTATKAGMTRKNRGPAPEEEGFPWCDECKSYHHPDNPTCRKRHGPFENHYKGEERPADGESGTP